MYIFFLKYFYSLLPQAAFELLQFGFIVLFSTFLYECVDYSILFKTTTPYGYKPGDKIHWNQVLTPMGTCAVGFGYWTWFGLFLAALFWMTKFLATLYHICLLYTSDAADE